MQVDLANPSYTYIRHGQGCRDEHAQLVPSDGPRHEIPLVSLQ